ncbi:MAG: radical SAM protein [Pseudomonadota bacterium]
MLASEVGQVSGRANLFRQSLEWLFPVDGKFSLRDRVWRAFAPMIPLFWFKRLPSIIVMDVTNLCNLRCPVCPVTIAMNRKRGLLKPDIFHTIIDDFKGQKKKPAIYFNFSGEPTLNAALPEFVAYATENGHDTFLSTNATKLTPELSERLIKAGLGKVYLCMDGFSKEAQEAYRVRSNFDEVKANIEGFMAKRRELGASNPRSILQTLLTAYSEDQIEDIKVWAKETGLDQIRFKTFSLGSYTSPEEKRLGSRFLPKRKEHLRHPTEKERSTCIIPTYQTVVFWNGDLGLCCIDYDQMIQLPNVGDGFISAYRSDEAARARKRGYLKQFDICKGCSLSNAEELGFRVDLREKVQATGERQPAV